MIESVPDIFTEDLADAKDTGCSTKTRPKINVDVSIIHDGLIQ